MRPAGWCLFGVALGAALGWSSQARADLIYVTSIGTSSTIVQIDSTISNSTTTWATISTQTNLTLGGLAIGSDGTLYSANTTNGPVIPYASADASSGQVGTSLGSQNSPTGLAFLGGKLYVAHAVDNYPVTSVTPGPTPTVAYYGGNVSRGAGITFDNDGNMLVAHKDANSIDKIAGSNQSITTGFISLTNAYGLAVTSKGTLYVTNQSGTISRYNASTGAFVSNLTSTTSNPFSGNVFGIAIGSNDNVYFSTDSGKVYEFNAQDSLITSWDVSNPGYLAVYQTTAVPEPSPLAMGVVEALLLGVGRVRKRWFPSRQSNIDRMPDRLASV